MFLERGGEMETVLIFGNEVELSEIRADVQAAKEKGLGGQWAFCPETVESLLDAVADLTDDVAICDAAIVGRDAELTSLRARLKETEQDNQRLERERDKARAGLKEIRSNVKAWIEHCDSAKEEGANIMLQGIDGLARIALAAIPNEAK